MTTYDFQYCIAYNGVNCRAAEFVDIIFVLTPLILIKQQVGTWALIFLGHAVLLYISTAVAIM